MKKKAMAMVEVGGPNRFELNSIRQCTAAIFALPLREE